MNAVERNARGRARGGSRVSSVDEIAIRPVCRSLSTLALTDRYLSFGSKARHYEAILKPNLS